jgi:hypothetical protein
MMLGQLLERSEHQTQTLTEIKSTLTTFDGRLRTIESKRTFRMPPIEKYLKDLLAILLPAYTLWATGSLTKALEVIQTGVGR